MKKNLILLIMVLPLLLTPSCRAVRDSATVGGAAAAGAGIGALLVPGLGAPVGAFLAVVVVEAFVIIRHDEEVRKDTAAGRKPESSIPRVLHNAAVESGGGSLLRWILGIFAVGGGSVVLYRRSARARDLVLRARAAVTRKETPSALS